MNLVAILKLAKLFGFDVDEIKNIALTEGVEKGELIVKERVRLMLVAVIPKSLKNLEKKAPLDGTPKTDKDGITMTDIEFLCHELTYLFCKAVIKKGGFGIDKARDLYFPKIVPVVVAAAPAGSTSQKVAEETVNALIEQVW